MNILEEANVLENTLFIFTSDHGEYFGEHGMWGHNPPPFVQGTRIPLLLVGPGIPQNARVRESVQLLDILPTVLDALGVDWDRLLFQGKSLLPLAHGDDPSFDHRVLYVEAASPGDVAFYAGNYHFMPKKNLIFDLRQDPEETTYFNRFFAEYALKSLSREVAHEYVRTYESLNEAIAPTIGDPVDVDPATLEQLRSLGYIH